MTKKDDFSLWSTNDAAAYMLWELDSEGHVSHHVYQTTKHILAERERELLELKGPCSTKACTLHHAHSGPCNIMMD